MSKNPWLVLSVLILAILGIFAFLIKHVSLSVFERGEPAKAVAANSILKLELDGVILDGKKFLKQLKKFRDEENIKAIVVEVNSPGGVVGPSQEIYQEILKTREVYEKPVVMVTTGLMASGAYYAAVAADKIVVSAGSMVGSIGVIMEFLNLEKLYDWAKVSRYTLTTGKFKDSGAEYRAMRTDEKELFQNLIDDVFRQFKDAVSKGRGLKPEFLSQYADGRVFTGLQAVKLGFADSVGTVDDAYDLAADLAKIDEYEIYDIPKHRPGLIDMIQGPDEEDDAELSQSGLSNLAHFASSLRVIMALRNRPLYLKPGSIF